MTSPLRRKRKDEIKISVSAFRDFNDYGSCMDIQREVWRFADIDITPTPMLLVTQRNGGILLGAYSSIGEMVGFVCSIVGMEGGELIQHSHMLAVRAAYRNFGVAHKLKLMQRKETLRRRIRTITWTFDPLQPLNAYFNLGKLGAWSDTYEENFYGKTSSSLHHGLPTDRFLVRWDLDSKAVERRLEEGPPRHNLRKEIPNHMCVNSLVATAPGVSSSSPAKLNCSDDELLFEVPYNLPEIKNRNLGVALEWQGRFRQVFRSYFKKGYAVTDFWIAEDDGRLRAFYHLRKKK